MHKLTQLSRQTNPNPLKRDFFVQQLGLRLNLALFHSVMRNWEALIYNRSHGTH